MSRMLATSIAGLLLLCAAPVTGTSQSTTRIETSRELSAGTRVRIKLPGEGAWTGTLVSLSADTMLVRGATDADTTLVRISRVTRLDVSRGPGKRRLARNTVIGVLAGGGLGWLVGDGRSTGGCRKGDYCWEHAFEFWMSGGENPPVKSYGAIGAAIGGVTGGALAALLSRRPGEHWERVPLRSRRAELTVSPWTGSVAIAF